MSALLTKHPVVALVALLVVGLLAWGFWPQPVLVETVTARRAPMQVGIEEEGRTRVIDRYVIAAPVDGVACRQQLDVGDPVAQGQELLGITPLQPQVLDPRSRAQAESRVAAAESALHAAEEQARAASADARLARSDLDRLRPLREQGLVSQDQYDRTATAVQTSAAARRSADFNVEVARHELDAARSALEVSAARTDSAPAERVVVRSPIAGRVLKVDRECEGPVRTGEPLLEVGDPTALEIEVDVLSADAVKIKPGMRVLFDRWGGAEPLEGSVRRIEPVGFTKISALGVEEQRVLVISDFTSPHARWESLGDGYRVEANFILWQEDDVLQVPSSSLFRYRQGWALFVVEGGTAVRRIVEVGQRNGLSAQILAGIEAGDRVINHPGDDVEDGRRVEVRRTDLDA
jgi:HlyD family secretion protein